jgi:putative transposase
VTVETLEAKDKQENVALFRMQVLGGLPEQELGHGQLRAALRNISEKRFRPPGSDVSRQFSVVTLERWYYALRKHGPQGLKPKRRKDHGRGRALSTTIRELLLGIRREKPSVSVGVILTTLEMDGVLARKAVSASTVRRLYREHGLDRQGVNAPARRTRRRWTASNPGLIWHADVHHRASISSVDGKKIPVRIHAIMDDASRYVTAIAALSRETESDMLGLFVQALRRHPAPKVLYLDNGSTYRGETLAVACTRLGIALRHAAPYDPQARGKMERWWRTLDSQCLDLAGSHTSLEALQECLDAYLARHYHVSPHASLVGRSPGAVWGEGTQQRGTTLTEQKLADAMTIYVQRRVYGDCVVHIGGMLWETDQGYLAGRTVKVGRCVLDIHQAPWIEHQDQRLTLAPVDPKANAHRRRKALPAGPAQGSGIDIPFDPVATLLRLHRSNIQGDKQ